MITTEPNDTSSFYSRIVHHPWKVILCTMLLVGLVGYFMQFVTPSITFKDMLGANWPGLKDYDFIQSEYTKDDNLLVLIEAKNGDAFTNDILGGVKDLTSDLWTTPFSVRVDSVTNFQHTEAEGDDLRVADLIPRPLELNETGLAKVKRIATTDPISVFRVVNPEGNVLAVNVTFHFPNEEGDEKLKANDHVQALAEQFRHVHPDTNVYVGGLTALDATVMKISMRETGLFLGLVLLVVVVLLAIFLRVILPILASVLVLIFSIMAAMALSGMMGWKLTPFTSSVPMIVLIIGVADCVHLITTYVQRLRNGEAKKQALVSALRLNTKSIVVTSVTTAVGLMTLNFSGSLGIAALGSQSAFGVMFACLLSITFLPAMLSLLPARSHPRSTSPDHATKYEGVTALLYRNRKSILVFGTLLSVVMGYTASTNTFDDRIPTYFAKSLPWRQANDFSEEQFGSAYTFTYSIDAGSADAVSDPVYLQKIETFANYLRTLPKVAYVKSVTDTFKRLNKNMHGDDPAYYRLPDDREMAAQYLLLYEMSLPYGLDLNDQINLDKSASKILATFESMSVSEVLALEAQINQWLDDNLPDVDYLSTGVQIMFAHLMSRDTKGLTMGAIYGLIVISFLLIWPLRSFKIGLLSLLPNILPVLFAFGVWGLFIGQVGFGLAMVSGMSIGIIVDDTVHFLTKYQQARRDRGLNAQQAVAYTFRNVGPSIVFTTVVLVVGFIMMTLVSEFRVNSDMGRMTSIILIFALLFDLIVLPVLLMIFDHDKHPSETPVKV